MKKLLPFCLFIFVTLLIKAQPTLSWQKSYGGSGHEYAWQSIPTSDGGFAFVGFSESTDGDLSGHHGTSTNNDLWVCKLSAAGTVQWSKLYGGSEDDEGYGILQTADNGFIVAGWTESADGDVTGHHGSAGSSDFWVLKLNSSGDLTWNQCYGGTSDDEAAAIIRNSAGDYYIGGSTYSSDGDVSGNHAAYESDFWVIKISSTYSLLKQKCVGGTDYDEGISMTLTSDDGCVIAGRTSSADGDAIGYHSGADMLVARLNSDLNLEWSHCYGGSGTEECNSIVELSDGSLVALGYASTHNNGDITGHHGSQGTDDFWLVKLTSTGTLIWAKCYGGDSDDQANGLTKTLDGGLVMSGLTFSTNGDVSGIHSSSFFDPDIWVAKVNAAGDLQWQRCCGGSGQDESFNVYEESNGVYVVTGFTYSADYDVTVNYGSADGWILKVTGVAGMAEIDEHSIQVYPNPFDDKIIVSDLSDVTKIEIHDALGRLICCYENLPFNSLYTMQTASLEKGMYLIGLIGPGFRKTVKMIK